MQGGVLLALLANFKVKKRESFVTRTVLRKRFNKDLTETTTLDIPMLVLLVGWDDLSTTAMIKLLQSILIQILTIDDTTCGLEVTK